ncbi:MAG: response regulator, partial [Deltaproteobacteria bacterium]|nr:response regulator [Deltaproteobacteria bacterium]
MTIKILLAGRHESMRLSLRSILAGREGLSIVGEAVADAEIFGLARGVSPDLILLDVEMPDLTGLEVIRRLHQELPEVRIMALAIHSDKRFVRETLKAGAVGYLLKYSAHEELLGAIDQVMRQGSYLSPGLEGIDSLQQAKDLFSHGKIHPPQKEATMPYKKKVKDLMIPLEDYPHIPYWFTLRQAMAIVREAAIKFEGSFEPRAVLVFDEKYQLMGMLTLRDVIRGLEPKFAQDRGIIKADPNLAVLMGDMFGADMKEQSQKPVSDVMSPIKVTVNGDDPITKALFLMINEN